MRHPLQTNSYAKETKYTPLSSLQELFMLESKPREQHTTATNNVLINIAFCAMVY